MYLCLPNVSNTKSTKQTKPEFETGQIFVMIITISLFIAPKKESILKFSSRKNIGKQ